MKIQMQSKLIIALMSILLFAMACKTTKDAAGSGTLEGMADAEIFVSMVGSSLQYQTLSGNLNVNIKTSKNSLGSKASIKMVRDEKIQLSFQPFLGIEAFRMELTPDSVFIIDRLNKRYAAENYYDLAQLTQVNFNFYNLQDLFTNRLFLAGKNRLEPTDYELFSIKNDKDRSLLLTKKDKREIRCSFVGDPSHKIQSFAVMKDDQTKAVFQSAYENFQPVAQNQLFPMSMNMILNLPSDEVIDLKFNYSKVELDKDLNLQFNVPNKYQRIRLDEALKIIKSM